MSEGQGGTERAGGVHGGGKAGQWSVGNVLTRAEESPSFGNVLPAGWRDYVGRHGPAQPPSGYGHLSW